MIVVFSGSRDFTNEVAVLVALRAVAKYGATVHVGDARGLDEIVRRRCEDIGIPCVVHKAQWRDERGRLDRSAGIQRNARMIAAQPDRVVAFYGPNGETPGTRNTVTLAQKAGIPVVVFHERTAQWEHLSPVAGTGIRAIGSAASSAAPADQPDQPR